MRRQTQRRVLPWIVIVALFVLWELVVRVFGIEQFVLPAPSAIFASGWEWRWPILDNAWQTFMTTAIGFFIAVVFGLLAGIAIGSSTMVYDGFYPALIGFNTIPKVAVIPILVIWFGIGTVPAIITAFLLSFFPILVNVATGIDGRAGAARRLARARRHALAGDPEGRAAALDAVFLRLAEGRDHGRLRRIDRRRDGGGQQGHRQPDAGRLVSVRGAAGLRRAPGHQRHGDRHVPRCRSRGAPHDRLGDTRHRYRDKRSRMKTRTVDKFTAPGALARLTAQTSWKEPP